MARRVAGAAFSHGCVGGSLQSLSDLPAARKVAFPDIPDTRAERG